MATVRIGTKDCDVKIATLGFLRRLLPVQRKVREAKTEEETIDGLAELVLAYVSHNEGVDLAFLMENVPANPNDLLRECLIASGQKVAAPGEAKST